jgi:hypothetical protein
MKLALEKRDSEIYAALLAYQNGRYEKLLIALGELSGPLTALFFALSESGQRGFVEPAALLVNKLSATASTVTLLTAKNVNVGDDLSLNGEVITVTGIPTSSHIEVNRGQKGTTAVAHDSYSYIYKLDGSVRLGAATNPDLSKAYITGTKDGLATAKNLLAAVMEKERKYFAANASPAHAYAAMGAEIIERQMTQALSAETQKTQQAEDKQ